MEKFFCGKLEDAARKIYEAIDFDKRTCPRFDIAVSCPYKIISEITASDVEAWIGIKMITEFNTPYIVLYMGFYGGGGARCVEFDGLYKYVEIKDLCNAIKKSAAACDYPVEENEPVYVEIQE